MCTWEMEEERKVGKYDSVAKVLMTWLYLINHKLNCFCFWIVLDMCKLHVEMDMVRDDVPPVPAPCHNV